MSHFRRRLFCGILALNLATQMMRSADSWAASKELSFHFQGLGPNAGGTPVLGGRFRWDWAELSVHSFTYDGLAITGTYRSIWKENSLISPSLNLSARRYENDIQVGPGLSVALTLPFFSLGRVGLRFDNDVFYSLQSGSFQPEYLIGVTYLLPGGNR